MCVSLRKITEKMKIGIIVAMSKELNLLLPLMNDREVSTVGGVEFHCGRIGGHEVVAMQCGIGKVNAALGASALIERFSPQLVINTGVAGGTGVTRVLDIVVGERVAYHDVWCGPGTEYGEASGCPRMFTSAPSVVSLPELRADDSVRFGLIASGDIFVSKAEEVERIRSVYPDVMAVDMESASIAQVCFMRNVPFFCLRVISDTPGGADNIAQYENFWEDAPRHTFNMLTRLLPAIKNV